MYVCIYIYLKMMLRNDGKVLVTSDNYVDI